MTSCLLVKAPDRLMAVADGRLAVSETQVSFDRTKKIQRFTPRYRIPNVMMARFSHYDEFTGSDCFVAYAGTYALAGEVLALFRTRITEALVLVWRDGVATLSDDFDEDAAFGEYYFRSQDCPEIGEREVMAEFREAAQAKVDEYCATRGRPADCEFLVFGKIRSTRRHYAYKLTVDPVWSPGQRARLNVEPIGDGALAIIGSTDVAGRAFSDEGLRLGLEGWREDQEERGVSNMFAEMRSRGEPRDAAASNLAEPPADRNWSSDQVATKFVKLLQAGADPFVGGELLMARGRWFGEIELETL